MQKIFIRLWWQNLSLTETSMWFRELTPSCSLNHTEHIRTVHISDDWSPLHTSQAWFRLKANWSGIYGGQVETRKVFLRTLPSFTLSIIPPLLDILSRNYGWLYTISETVFKCYTLKVIWKSQLVGSVSKIQNVYIASRWCREEPQDFQGLLCFNSRSRWLRGLVWVCGRVNSGIAGSNSSGSRVIVEGFQEEVSASGLSFVQRSPTECSVSEFDRNTSTMRRPWPTGGCRAMEKEIIVL
jgi:hypothetical protein